MCYNSCIPFSGENVGDFQVVCNLCLLPPATKLGQGNIFRSVCPHSVHGGGACVVAPRGGMHGCSGGGVCGCSGGDVRGIRRDTEIRSMSGRYASYWNAFFFKNEISCQEELLICQGIVVHKSYIKQSKIFPFNMYLKKL